MSKSGIYTPSGLLEFGGGTEYVPNPISDAYDSTKAYYPGDYFIYDNTLYKVRDDNNIVSVTGQTPPNVTYYTPTDVGTELSSLNSGLINNRVTFTPVSNLIQTYNISSNIVGDFCNINLVLAPKTSFASGWNTVGALSVKPKFIGSYVNLQDPGFRFRGIGISDGAECTAGINGYDVLVAFGASTSQHVSVNMSFQI